MSELKKYLVVITRVEYQRAEVEVEAEDEDEAREEAAACESDCFETVNANQDVESVREVT